MKTLLDYDPNSPAMTPAERRRLFNPRKGPKPSGYAAPPGTGPQGETCKTCQHIERISYAKTYLKCGKFAAQTHGKKTDILASSPACRLWEQPHG